jgi:hypothetical protein
MRAEINGATIEKLLFLNANRRKLNLKPGKLYRISYREEAEGKKSSFKYVKIAKFIKEYPAHYLFRIIGFKGSYRECFLRSDLKMGIVKIQEVQADGHIRGKKDIKELSQQRTVI